LNTCQTQAEHLFRLAVTYQRPSRYWIFQWSELGIFIAVIWQPPRAHRTLETFCHSNVRKGCERRLNAPGGRPCGCEVQAGARLASKPPRATVSEKGRTTRRSLARLPGMNTDEKRATFRALHVKGSPLIMPNPADIGSARVLASIGFAALATTSGGFAATLGRADYRVSRAEAISHAEAVASSVDVPVSADLENGFADRPGDVAMTVKSASETGLAGCSIEDYTTRTDDPLYATAEAAERVAAAAEAAHRGPGSGLVLTARAENYLRGHLDLADTIGRLQAFQAAGADVLYAPGLVDLSDIRALVSEVDLPVNVLLLPGGPGVPELAGVGVARISVGSAFHHVAVGALARAGRQLLDERSSAWMDLAAEGRKAIAAAFA
jgi:2-methylisocitrate lyase-like PEP mutase family enzyme